MNKCESCYNMECVFVDNQIPFFDSENCQNYRGLTNADRIRGMTDEELARFIARQTGRYCDFKDPEEEEYPKVLSWLKAPVEEGEG